MLSPMLSSTMLQYVIECVCATTYREVTFGPSGRCRGEVVFGMLRIWGGHVSRYFGRSILDHLYSGTTHSVLLRVNALHLHHGVKGDKTTPWYYIPLYITP